MGLSGSLVLKKRLDRPGGDPRIYWFSLIFSLSSALGYSAPMVVKWLAMLHRDQDVLGIDIDKPL